MKKGVWFLVFVLSLAECTRPVYRQNLANSKIESRVSRMSSKPRAANLRHRGVVFENLLNVYDPSFLAVVWPRISNGVHLFVEPACWDHLGVFFKDLSDGRAWAYRAVDASGRYRSGLFQGNRFWLGSKDECLQLDNSFIARDGSNETAADDEFQNREYLNAILRREKYFEGGTEEWRSLVHRDELMRRLVLADHRPPYRLRYAVLQMQFNLTKITMAQSYDITLGVCLPRSCRLEDIQSVINFSIMINDNFKSNKSLPRSLKVTSLRSIERYYDITTDIGALILICVTVLLTIIAVIATVVDLRLIKCRTRASKAMSFDLQRIDTYNNLSRARTSHVKGNHHYDYLMRKQNLVDLESLTINNINNSNNLNRVSMKKVTKPNVMTISPSVTLDLDLVSMDRVTGSCKRCGKYKKQCNSSNQSPRFHENLPACPRVKSIASLTVGHRKKEPLLKSILLCFSLRNSWRKIFNTNMANKDLSMIHLLRTVAIFWIMFVHVTMIANYASEDGGDVNDHNNAFYILATGTLAFDTLFFVSGVFSAHHFFFLRAQYSVEQLVSCGGVCGHVLQLVCFITNRAIRLLPPYAYVIFLSAVWSRVSVHTSAFPPPDGDHTCDRHWWRNLLYITTAFPDHQCMQISWYMSLETQLHALGALACALSVYGRRATASVVGLGVIIAAAADLSGAYTEFGTHFANVYSAYSTLIERPLSRVAPYFAGVLTGWLVHKLDGEIRISKSRAGILWAASALSLLASLCAPCPWLAPRWLAPWLHAAWLAALLWPAVVLATKYSVWTGRLLASPLVAALSRLTYPLLLLHGPVATALLLHSNAVCAATVCIWSYFAGVSILSTVLALLLSLLVDTPCCSLFRTLADRAT